MPEQQVAVLIDYENVGLERMQWLFDQLADAGRIIVKRAYADWSAAGNKRDQLLELGIEPVHLFHSGGRSKNASDIRLAIDAVDLLHQSPVDTFVIVSSDSDFVPLVNKLRASGKTIIGAGPRATASQTLVTSCDRYYYLEIARSERGADPVVQKPHSDSLLVRAMQAVRDDQGRVGGGKLHQTLQRLDPTFSFRDLGYSTFTGYLKASPVVKVTRAAKRGGDVVVELAEGNALPSGGSPNEPEAWAVQVDAAWSRAVSKLGQWIPGTKAAAVAAEVLGVPKLSASRYKTLQRLLDESEYLQARWKREGNHVIQLVPHR